MPPRQGRVPEAPPSRQVSRRPVGLDSDTVVAAALALIDERGAASFTIRDLGSRLGVSAPTIYWHIGSKAQLYEAIVDHVVGDMAVTGQSKGSWEERLRRFLVAARTQLLAHPGVMELMRLVHSPAFERWAAEALDIMSEAGFGDRDAATYARTALLHALGCAHVEATTARTVSYMEQVPGEAGTLEHRVKPELLADHLESRIASMTSYDLDEQHRIMTDVFIDGMRAALARARQP
jgi:AcrR family transcriptional regulator